MLTEPVGFNGRFIIYNVIIAYDRSVQMASSENGTFAD